ncbi:putative ribonuclease H-like domain-containing protein [Tanacetum coccineum]|uniref:Ribonuclease H-like domain-containing protein n=1 Tax=Tanacetum coccineum TaxID=301880 RepID=A0ABQ5IVG4_9ASTR
MAPSVTDKVFDGHGSDDENPPPPPPQQTPSPTQTSPSTLFPTIKLLILKKGCPPQRNPIKSSLGLYLLPGPKYPYSCGPNQEWTVLNVAFVSSESTSSTNDVSTAYGISTSSGYNSQRENSSSYTDEIMYSFFANQSSGPHLDHEDLEQLDEFDLEEMDLKWQVAMISIRLKKFYKKRGRRLAVDAGTIGFDKTKVECYICHNTGHFARECRSKGNQDSRRRDAGNTGYKEKDNARRPKKQVEPKALVTLDREGVDWTGHAEDEQENFALMAYNNSGSDTEKGQGTGQGENRSVWNNVQRLNHQNKFVPTAVLTRTSRIPVNTARQNLSSQAATTSTARKVNAARPIMNKIRQRNNFYKSYSPIRRPFNKTTAPKSKFSNQKVNTTKIKSVSAVGEKRETVIKPSAGYNWRPKRHYWNKFSKYNGGSNSRKCVNSKDPLGRPKPKMAWRRNNHKDTSTACLLALPNLKLNPRRYLKPLEDESWVDAMQEEHVAIKISRFMWMILFLVLQRGHCVMNKRCDEFEALMKSRFQMSSIGELTFFLGLQTACTPIETHNPLVKDAEAADVDIHLYRSMIGSLMYLTASRPDIMFAVCACSRFQVTPKTLHLYDVKRIFSDYGSANLDRKSTTGGCQFLGHRLISWQCKKQTIVATSTTEAEYVAAANCYGQVLWIQNQMLDYGFNFMNTRIYIDNESTICIVKNPVFHSKTKHIEIRHHFIRDAYEKKLIQVLKIHIDDNVVGLLTKAFVVSRRWVVDDMMTFEVHMLPVYYRVNTVQLILLSTYGLELSLDANLRKGNYYKHGCSLSVGFNHHTTNGHQFTMSNRQQELASPEQTASGKDFSNPLIVDSLLKTIWLSMHHVIAMKHWLFQGKRQLVKNHQIRWKWGGQFETNGIDGTFTKLCDLVSKKNREKL